MKFKKKDLSEIIDSNGELIGGNDTPSNGSDLESQANNTTDYNAKIGTQPFRYDMLGRFGFTLMPFMENDGHDNDDVDVLNDLEKFIQDLRLDILTYYYKNPNKLKSDYRKLSSDDFKLENNNKTTAKAILKIVQDNLDKTYEKQKNIDEAAVVEDKMLEKKSEEELSGKRDCNDIKDKKLQKVAGLINKLEKKDIDKLITLLERK